MTTVGRKQLLLKIEELCARYPHWRFGQLVSNVAGWTGVNIWDVEDDQLLQAVTQHLGERFGHENEKDVRAIRRKRRGETTKGVIHEDDD